MKKLILSFTVLNLILSSAAFSQSGWFTNSTTGGIIAIRPIEEPLPSAFSREQNYPNPFNPVTNIKFSLPKSSYTTLKVYDALGNSVITLLDGYKPAGNYVSDFDAGNLSSGIYFYNIFINGVLFGTKKLVLIK